jgi:hypothetical protein
MTVGLFIVMPGLATEAAGAEIFVEPLAGIDWLDDGTDDRTNTKGVAKTASEIHAKDRFKSVPPYRQNGHRCDQKILV